MSGQAAGTAPARRRIPEGRRRWLALYVLCAGMLMIVLDSTIVNVALPSIRADLNFSRSNLAWVVNAYLITFGGLLMLAGRLGDLVGQRRMFLIGLTVFTAASLVCGLATSQGVLVAGRFAQGAGSAMTSAVILAMIAALFPEPAERARAVGIYTFVAVAGGSLGLLAGGILTESISWHWIFFVNLPIGAATGFLALRFVEGIPGIGWSRGADMLGAALLTGGLMLGVYTIVGVTGHGWASARTLSLAGAAVALLAGFVARQATAGAPLMPLRVFRAPGVAGANAVQALFVAGLVGTFFLGTLYLQGLLGYGPLDIGLAFLPWTIAMAAMSLRFAARLIQRFGTKATLLPGIMLIAAGLLLFARTPVHAHYASDILPAVTLMGAGVGLAAPSVTTLAMAGASPDESGIASGLINTSLQLGGAAGLAVLATLAATRTNALLAAGNPAAQALNSGYHLAYLAGASLAAGALALALIAFRSPTAAPPPEPTEPASAGHQTPRPHPMKTLPDSGHPRREDPGGRPGCRYRQPMGPTRGRRHRGGTVR
jgi:EmrB/QacA subfamily drug resistance transporter